MVGAVIIVGVLVIAAVFLLASLPSRGTDELGESPEARDRAALRVIMSKGVLGLYSELGSPESEIRAVERRIPAVREWVETVPDARDRRALHKWLDHAEYACGRSRASRIKAEETARAAARMSRY